MTEVEVKIRLPSREEHDKVFKMLGGKPNYTYNQRNVFFDGVKGELCRIRGVLRLRFYEHDGKPKCLVTLKEDTKLIDGISKSGETEDYISPDEGLAIVKNPCLISTSACPLLKQIVVKYSCTEFKCLGEFNNTRDVFAFSEHKLELDETHFDFGLTWEIEVETATPEILRSKLEQALTNAGIKFSYSKKTKFANFITKTVD